MRDIIRDAPLGQIVRFLSKNTLLRYAEEVPGFKVPFDIAVSEKEARPIRDAGTRSNRSSGRLDDKNEDFDTENAATENPQSDAQRLEAAAADTQSTNGSERGAKSDIEHGLDPQRSMSIRPHVTNDGKTLVTWYSTDDPVNPQNWSQGKKFFVSGLIWCVSPVEPVVKFAKTSLINSQHLHLGSVRQLVHLCLQ